MIQRPVDFPEELYEKVAACENGGTFSGAVVTLCLLGLVLLKKEEEERARIKAGGTQIDFDALRRVQGYGQPMPEALS
jgi:hypothetical protein